MPIPPPHSQLKQASTPSPSPSSRCTYGWIRSQAGTLFWGRTIKKRGNFIVPPAQVPTPKKLNLFLGVVQKSNSSLFLLLKHRNRSYPPPRLNILLFMLNYCYYQYYPSICTQYKLNMNFHSSVPPSMLLFSYLPELAGQLIRLGFCWPTSSRPSTTTNPHTSQVKYRGAY